MTEQEARELCARLSAEHPDRHTHHWVVTKQKEEWVVVKIGLPPPTEGPTTEVHTDQRPLIRDDPREENPWIKFPPWISGGSG